MNKLSIGSERISLLYFFALSASVLLSAWLGYRETVINPDGICYLMSAQRVGSASLKEVANLCPQSQWPFYPILIYGLAHISHLSYTVAAYLMNGFFSLLSVTAFILIIKEIGGTSRVLWLAAFTILLSHEFNSVREYIIRDHGFWTFYLWSLLFLLRYFRNPHFKMACFFNISLLIATLFRIEGAIFLLALPFLSWFYLQHSFQQRVKYFFSLHFFTIILCAAMGVGLLLYPQQGMAKLGRIAEIMNQLQHGISLFIERYHTAKIALLQHVLNQDAESDAGLVLILVWVSWYVVNVLGTLSWIYGALVIYAWCTRALSFTSHAALVMSGYLGVNVLVTFSFLVERSFLSKRYLMALALTCMVWIPFALNQLIQKSTDLRHRIALAFVAFFIFISSIGGILDFGYSKSYIHAAGDWISQHIPQQASLYSNDFQLMYYSQHFGSHLFTEATQYLHTSTIAQGQWKQYDYLALRMSAKHEGEMANLLREITFPPIAVFSNKRGDKIAIYKVLSLKNNPVTEEANR